jgi:Fic family protein
LFEFVSISTILRRAPIKYARSFLYTETDDNDVTYFIVAQTQVIRRAIDELHAYIDRKTAEVRELETKLRVLRIFNHRQAALIRHALKHPHQEYTIQSHQESHNVVYQTARSDLLNLREKGVLNMSKRGKMMIFVAPPELSKVLKNLDSDPKAGI